MAGGASIGIEIDGKRYDSAAEGLRALAEETGRSLDVATPALRTEMEFYLKAIALAMEKRHSLPWSPGAHSSSDRLFRRSGELVKAIKDSVKVSGEKIDDLEGRIGAALVYANIQEYGGTIHPKHGKYLTIPLPSALTAQGTPILPSARAWKNTFIATSKAGNKLIFLKKPNGQVVPLYVLKTKVTIPKRLGLGDTLRTGAGAFTDRAMNAMLKAMVEQKL
jgi:hypothetical protein